MKVLIKEDSLTYKNIFQSYLESLNIEFTFIEDDLQVFENFPQEKFDLYILSSPREAEANFFLNTILQREHKPNILVCTGDLNLEKKIEYLKKGVNYFLKKPFTLQRFQEILEVVQPELRQYGDLEILIAEDSEPTQKVIKIYLSKQKLKVKFAFDGKEALEILTSEPERFHLIITDINMPNMDGTELAKMIRYALENLEIPIVFLSGDEDIQNSEEFLSLASGWIQKPFSNDIYQKLIPYLEQAKSYKRQKNLINQNKVMSKFINTLYSQFERSCVFNVKLLLHSVEQMTNKPEIFNYPVQRIKQELPLLQEFLLENAIYFDFPNTFKVQQVCSTIIKSLESVIEYKRIKIISNIQDDLVTFKINFILFQFIFHEFLVSFILTLSENEQIEIYSYFKDRYFCIEFKMKNLEAKLAPIWILEKLNLELSINTDNDKKSYTLNFEILSK